MANRLERVEELLRRELSLVLVSGKLRDPRLQDPTGIAITAAKVSADLASARVFVDVLDPARREAVLRALRAAAGRIQGLVGRNVQLKRTPRLFFEYDEALERGRRVEAVLAEIGASQGRPGAGEDDG